MAICERCDGEFSDGREKLGYKTCLVCGEEDAQIEIEKKKLRVATPYNKGPYMFITSRSMVKDLGR